MSNHGNLRKDKTCLNCRHVVENKFCPNCGQKNEDTRKTFHHLFVHFFEDLTHYENAFWRTIKNLLLKPASLTKEYLSGKRLSYLAPVRLYIFISFVTFFIFTILAKTDIEGGLNIKSAINDKKIDSVENLIKNSNNLNKSELDSLKTLFKKIKEKKENVANFGYTSVHQMDSIRKFSKTEEINDFEYLLNKKAIEVNERFTKKEIITKFLELYMHNMPKVLFIYMPIFAFFLWLFHNKKKWYYFDHGIFTLHYFSFLLLIFLILFVIGKIADLFGNNTFVSTIVNILNVLGSGWMLYYFFPAHHRFYEETRTISFIKSMLLFFINMLIILIILTLFTIYTFINIH